MFGFEGAEIGECCPVFFDHAGGVFAVDEVGGCFVDDVEWGDAEFDDEGFDIGGDGAQSLRNGWVGVECFARIEWHVGANPGVEIVEQ